MPKTNLSPEDKAQLITAINNDTEPNAELLAKFFPGTAEKFDLKALDRAKIPTLEYAGKRTKAAILAEAGAGIGAAPLQTLRCFGESKKDEWQNLIVQGDNLQFLKTCYNNTDTLIKDKVKGKVKLIYIDPPFATKSDFGGKDGERSYSDKVATAEFIESLRERLIYLRELLADDGSIYLHLDQKMSHYAKIMMDEIFGKDSFLNELIWAYKERETSKRFYNRKHDVILFYVKSNNFKYPFNFDMIRELYSEVTIKKFKYADENNRKYRLRGKDGTNDPAIEDEKTYRQYLDTSSGPLPRDWFVMPFVNQASEERIGYPTQKPEALLERIILASSEPGDIVLDSFAGSGTIAAVAEKLGRRWITCDFGKHSIYTMQKRLLGIGESKTLIDEKNNAGEVIVKKGKPYKKEAKPYCILSSGAYDFSHVMELRQHKNAYVDFVLGLFQLVRDEEKTKKFKLTNIYSIKDSSPVEVYPVWDERFLREVRIDEAYLRGIIKQSGGKLKGEYIIITPESCTNIGDTTLKNQDGKPIQFLIQTFPYKVFEEISRNLELQEQPSSQDNVNNLITSTAFYFNEDVKIAVERTEEGFRITEFETDILNKEKQRFAGFSGIAMLLLDLNYDPEKPFAMDKTVFAKEIKEDGSVIFAGLTQSVGLIAIDKHGNESKPVKLG